MSETRTDWPPVVAVFTPPPRRAVRRDAAGNRRSAPNAVLSAQLRQDETLLALAAVAIDAQEAVAWAAARFGGDRAQWPLELRQLAESVARLPAIL